MKKISYKIFFWHATKEILLKEKRRGTREEKYKKEGGKKSTTENKKETKTPNKVSKLQIAHNTPIPKLKNNRIPLKGGETKAQKDD